MSEPKIPLEATIAAVKDELAKSVRSAVNGEIQFPIGEVTLEFQIGITRSTDGKAGVNVWVLELGATGAFSRESVQTVTVQLLAPTDRDGNPIMVAAASSKKLD